MSLGWFSKLGFNWSAIIAAVVTISVNEVQAQSPDTSSSPPAKAQACVACHGANGISPNDFWPNLAGQKPQYLRDALKAYKSGARKNEMMSPFAQTLSDEDIDQIARYYSSLKSP